MQRISPTEIIPAIINSLRNGQQTLSQLSRSSDINRVTLTQYIYAFEKAGIIISRKEGREKIMQLRNNPDSYFDLPIKEEDNKYLSTIYAYIKETCKKLYNKEPTKTQVYKILYELKKPLPIGWYQHGPCAVRIYRGNEKQIITLTKEDKTIINKKVKEYCCLNNFDLQKKIYTKENNRLYLIKEKLLNMAKPKKDELNLILSDMIRNVPKETIDVSSDFMSTVLMLGWEKTKTLFRDFFWKYISLVAFKESLKGYYGDAVDDYLAEKIEKIKDETRKTMFYMVRDYMGSKYSGDKHYEQYLKQRHSTNL